MPPADPDEARAARWAAFFGRRSAPQGSGVRSGSANADVLGLGHAPRLEYAHMGLAGEPFAALAGLPTASGAALRLRSYTVEAQLLMYNSCSALSEACEELQASLQRRS